MKIEQILEEINKDFMDIPFGNSLFQIKHFVINQVETPFSTILNLYSKKIRTSHGN